MKAYIFDLDGTILDSIGIWLEIDALFLSKRNISVPKDYHLAVGAMTLAEAAKYTIERFCLTDTVKELCDELMDLAYEAYGSVKAKPNVIEYLLQIKEKGVPLAIASSLSMKLIEISLKNLGIYDLFEYIATSDEANSGKETPEVFLLAAEKLGVSPKECIVFEDTLPAILSAKSIGMTVYGVLDNMSKPNWEEIKRAADGYFFDFKDAPSP